MINDVSFVSPQRDGMVTLSCGCVATKRDGLTLDAIARCPGHQAIRDAAFRDARERIVAESFAYTLQSDWALLTAEEKA